MMNGYIYIVSNPENIAMNRYKIGFTTVNQKKLIKKYTLSLMNPLILLYLQCEDYKRTQSKIKTLLKDITVKEGNYFSDWVLCQSLYKLIINIIGIVQHNDILSTQYNNILLKYELKDYYEDPDDYSFDNYLDEIITPIITTFKDFLQFTSIGDIVITDKQKLTGYLKFKESIWYKLHPEKETDSKDDYETLLGFLDKNHTKSKYKCTLCDTSCNQHKQKIIQPKYVWSSIIHDIVENYYNNYPDFYTLQAHEFVVCESDKPTYKNISYQILNTRAATFTHIPTSSILTHNKECALLTYMRNPDTSIITQLLNVYMKHDKLDEFKIFCRGVFFNSQEYLVFEDQYPCFSLARLLIIMMEKLGGDMYHFYSHLDFEIPLKCIILEPHNMGSEKYPYEKTTIQLQKRGIKCIIILREDIDLYDIKGCNEYIIKNYDTIHKSFSDKDIDVKSFKYLINENKLDEIYGRGIWTLFESSKYLFTYVVHWFINFIKE